MNDRLPIEPIRAQELRDAHKDFLAAKAGADFRLVEEQKRVRISRALSWLEASENVEVKIESRAIPKKAGIDQSFIFLWISFNAAYGYDPHVSEPEEQLGERDIINRFIAQIKKIDDDADAALTALVKTHGRAFGELLRNPFMYWKFWQWVRNPRRKAKNFSSAIWKSSDKGKEFAKENEPLNKIKNKDEFLFVVFDRLRTLRNQIFHGGATYGPESLNLPNVESGQKVLALLVPTILKIMLDAPATQWRAISYPRISGKYEDWLDANRVTDSKS